jgi:hypothetical protein
MVPAHLLTTGRASYRLTPVGTPLANGGWLLSLQGKERKDSRGKIELHLAKPEIPNPFKELADHSFPSKGAF